MPDKSATSTRSGNQAPNGGSTASFSLSGSVLTTTSSSSSSATVWSWKKLAIGALVMTGVMLAIVVVVWTNHASSLDKSSTLGVTTTFPKSPPEEDDDDGTKPTTTIPQEPPPSSSPSTTTTTVNSPPTETTDVGHDDSAFQPLPVPRYTQRGTYRLLEIYPHDPQAFSQGLEVKNATHLYESIGLYGESAMRIVETKTGDVTRETVMPQAFFGEGVTLVQGDSGNHKPYLLQLTWQEKIAFTYHPETLEELSRFPYETTNTQGWGMAYDMHKDVVYVTDGTEFVHTWKLTTRDDGVSYQEIAKVAVTFEFEPPPSDGTSSNGPRTLARINELEYDPTTRTLLANVWYENVLVRIDIPTGKVIKVYDLSSIYTNRDPEADVLNGIAAIPNQPGRFYVTGKKWPSLYYIELVE